MSSSTWQVHFKDKLDGLLPPLEGSFLEQALLQSRLSEEEYFAWVLKIDTAPHLKAEFFTAHPPRPELLLKLSGPWGPLLFPVAEWDGQLIVAGLERPETELPAQCTFVYASPMAMAPWWAIYERGPEQNEAPEGINEISEPTKLNFTGVVLVSTISPPPVAETIAPAEVTTPPVAPAPVLTKAAAPMNVASAKVPHALSALSEAGDQLKNEVSAAFKSLEGLYDKTMFLALGERNESFVPLFWSESFGKPSATAPILTSGASLFSLVFQTEKPFHGPVSPSDQNDLFFKNWNAGETAPTATLVPFFYKGHLTGILLGLGNAELFRPTVLRQIETVCQDLCHHLGGDQTDSAVAA